MKRLIQWLCTLVVVVVILSSTSVIYQEVEAPPEEEEIHEIINHVGETHMNWVWGDPPIVLDTIDFIKHPTGLKIKPHKSYEQRLEDLSSSISWTYKSSYTKFSDLSQNHR